MAADVQPGRPLADAIGFGFQTIIEGLRRDVREDIKELREELRESVGGVDDKITQAGADWLRFTVDHGREHEADAEERRLAHTKFYEFIRTAELDAARRDGALGVIRFVIEKVSANSTRLVAVIVALASAILAITGQVHFVVGR